MTGARAPDEFSNTSARCTVRVPGSTSNLGAGFDCIGSAVDLWLTATVTCTEGGGVSMSRSGTLAQLECPVRDDLVWRGFAAGCAYAGREAPANVAFDIHSTIPIGRGLGSSGAAIVAGIVGASRLLSLDLSDAIVIQIAAAIDGHPDNVAPAVSGGTVLCVPGEPGGYRVAKLRVHRSLRFVFAIPDFEFRTSVARAVLPQTLPFATAASATMRSAALVNGLDSADPAVLRVGLTDVLHVPARREHINGYDVVVEAARHAGAIGATLSGSGSAIVAVATAEQAPHVAAAMVDAWSGVGVGAESLVSSPSVVGFRTEA